jgi:PD-(D/E)XK nuclease superfamily
VTLTCDFRTRTGAEGIWPQAPAFWSYTSLSAMESCPRRWMLERASYPELTENGGYPSRPSFAAISGSVVHESVEQILRALAEAGCVSIKSAAAVEVLRGMGGFQAVIEENSEVALARLGGDLRARPMLDPIRRKLEGRKSQLRRRTKGILARIRVTPAQSGKTGRSRGKLQIGKGDGVYSEVVLTAPAIRLRGRADLISIGDGACSISDFKTGKKSEQHADQLHVYELLWMDDTEVNPAGLPVVDLLVMYSDLVTHVEPLGPGPSAALRDDVGRRIRAADDEVARPLSRAIPEADKCAHCDVRHMCEDYWEETSLRPDPGKADPGAFLDCELVVRRRIGPRSWEVEFHGQRGVLRTRSESSSFESGESLRILGAAVSRDPESGALVFTETVYSESFSLIP